jgi:hypothetical protein
MRISVLAVASGRIVATLRPAEATGSRQREVHMRVGPGQTLHHVVLPQELMHLRSWPQRTGNEPGNWSFSEQLSRPRAAVYSRMPSSADRWSSGGPAEERHGISPSAACRPAAQ